MRTLLGCDWNTTGGQVFYNNHSTINNDNDEFTLQLLTNWNTLYYVITGSAIPMGRALRQEMMRGSLVSFGGETTEHSFDGCFKLLCYSNYELRMRVRVSSDEVGFSFWISGTSVPASVDLYMSTKIQFESYAGCMLGVCCLMLNLTHCTFYPYTVPLLSQCLKMCDTTYLTDQVSQQQDSCTVSSYTYTI